MPRTSSWAPPTTPFTLANVSPLGVTPRMIHRALRAGRITRLTHGVYVATSAVAGEPTARHLQHALALQLIRPTAIASHHTAALACDLDLVDTDAAAALPPAFILPTAPEARSESGSELSIAVRRLPQEHRDRHPSGLLVTTPARTAVDIAANHALPEALITLDSAARRTLRERVGSRRVRDHYANARLLESVRGEFTGVMGVAATQYTRAALLAVVPLVDPRRESALESLSYGEMVRAGFPLPELQVRIATPEGAAFPDFLWAEARVIGEADGKGKYSDPDALLREKRRQELLEEMGFRVIRWSWDQMRLRPAKVLQRIEAALNARMG